jgi:hypothetical protein
MIGPATYRQNTSSDRGMKGFDASVEHLRKSSDRRNIFNWNTAFANQAGRPTGGNEFGSEFCQLARKFDDARLVGIRLTVGLSGKRLRAAAITGSKGGPRAAGAVDRAACGDAPGKI